MSIRSRTYDVTLLPPSDDGADQARSIESEVMFVNLKSSGGDGLSYTLTEYDAVADPASLVAVTVNVPAVSGVMLFHLSLE